MVAAGFVLAFAAGGAVGILAGPEAVPPPREPRPGPGPFLGHELRLSPEQQEQMKRIWDETVGRHEKRWEQQRMELMKQRDEQMAAFQAGLSDEQRERFRQIDADFRQGMGQSMEEKGRLVQQAVEQTRSILTDEQKKRYEEMRWLRRPPRHGPGGPPDGPFHPGRPGGPGAGRPDEPGPGRRGEGPPMQRGKHGPFRRPGGPGGLDPNQPPRFMPFGPGRSPRSRPFEPGEAPARKPAPTSQPAGKDQPEAGHVKKYSAYADKTWSEGTPTKESDNEKQMDPVGGRGTGDGGGGVGRSA